MAGVWVSSEPFASEISIHANSEDSDITAQSHLNLHWLSITKVQTSQKLVHIFLCLSLHTMLSADKFGKQFGSRSGPTKCRA